MAKYIVEVPHTREECLKMMDEIASKKRALGKFDFGCMAGNHTGWAKVEARSEREALGILPVSLRKNACATKVSKVTPAQLKAFHEM